MKCVLKIAITFFTLAAFGSACFSQGMIIPSGAYVVQHNGNIVTHNNFTNNGTFIANGGTLVFSGTTQTLNGSSLPVLNNITVSLGSTTTIGTSGEQVKGVVRCNGTLNANGNLTLLSTSMQTALIDGAGTGTVSGNVIMQRYLASGFGYKYFSSPFQSATVNQFANEVNLSSAFPLVYKYDESLPSNGWYHYTTSSNALNLLAGYAVNFGSSSSPITVDMTGVINNNTVTSATLYNNNQTYTQGFNLIGNPYPSPIDWDAVSGWTRTNIDNAVYYFDAGSTDQYTGSYSSYINGVSSNGIANNIIPAMQGFFIHVSNGTYPVSATLAVNNNVRINNLTPVFHKQTSKTDDPLLRLNLRYEAEKTLSDNAVIYFNDDATAAYDKNMDALKLNNTNTRIPNIYTLAMYEQALSINAMPAPADKVTVIPLGIETAMEGPLVLHVQDIINMPYGLHIYIADAQTMSYQDITDNPTYRMNPAMGITRNRYSIVFSKKDIKDTKLLLTTLNAFYANGQIQVCLSLQTGDRGTLKIVNLMGQEVYKTYLEGYGYHAIDAPFSNGIYMVNFYGQNAMYTKKIFIGNQ